MKIFLNLLSVKQGGQVTRAKEFINNFHFYSNKNDQLIIVAPDSLKIKSSKSVKIIRITFPFHKNHWLPRMIWENTKQISLINLLKPDVYLTFSHSLPFVNINIPKIVAVSNLAPFSKLAFKYNTVAGNLKLFLLKQMIIFSTNRASSVISLSSVGKKHLINHGIPKKKISIIPNGVVKKNSSFRLNFSKNKKNKYILYVSHFYRYKNFEQLIIAYSKLDKKILHEFRLKLVGNFNDQKYLKYLFLLCKNLKIDHKVDFVEGVQSKKLYKIYVNATLFVFPSRIENCPNILLESLSLGLPILVSKTPPMPEFSGNACKYFNIDDPGDLNCKILKVIRSKKTLMRMCRMSFKRSKRYSCEFLTKKTNIVCRKSLLYKVVV